MMTDSIADYLTRIRNALQAKHRKVDIPASKMKLKLTKIIQKEGYIRGYTNIDDGKQGIIRIYLKFDTYGESIINGLKRISKPGCRKYCSTLEIPRVINNLGIAILSTSKGIMTNKEAKRLGVGGEVICYLW